MLIPRWYGGILILIVSHAVYGRENIKTPAKQEQQKTVDDEACALVKRFVDLSDKTLSWHEFTSEMIRILQLDVKYKDLVQTFKDISTSTSIVYISYKLAWYKDSLPPKTHALLYNYSANQLTDFISARIKLNKK